MDRPNSIIQKLKNITKCEICFNDYNRSDKQPVIICSMHHTVCRECMANLENRPNCPFCRERIKFDKVVVNNYINQLLPSQEIKPNTRVEIKNGSQKSGYPAQANRFTANQPSRSLAVNQTYQTGPNMSREFSVPNLNGELVRINPPVVPPPVPVSINNQALQRVYEQDFPHGEHQWDNGNEESQQLTIYKCIYILQLPFTFFNLYFALTSPQSECMDKPHRLTILVVRPWLMSMGIIEASLMILFLFGLFLYFKRVIQHSTFQKFKFILAAVFLIKILVWLFAELQLFEASIARFCSGGVYAYGVVMTIMHGICFLVICCIANCRY